MAYDFQIEYDKLLSAVEKQFAENLKTEFAKHGYDMSFFKGFNHIRVNNIPFMWNGVDAVFKINWSK